jgi:hypothetical protein
VLRLLHLVVIAGLVSAAAYVYKIKFDATVQAEQVAKIRRDIRRERDAIALFGRLPPRPPQLVPPDAEDAIAALIENIDTLDVPTGSTRPPPGRE